MFHVSYSLTNDDDGICVSFDNETAARREFAEMKAAGVWCATLWTRYETLDHYHNQNAR